MRVGTSLGLYEFSSVCMRVGNSLGLYEFSWVRIRVALVSVYMRVGTSFDFAFSGVESICV
jgi:hypothetical protein